MAKINPHKTKVFWNTGKEFYTCDKASLASTESLPIQTFKTVGYAQRKTGQSGKKDGIQTFAVLLKTPVVVDDIPQIEHKLQCLFSDANCNAKIETCIILPDNKCITTISITDAATNRKYSTSKILKHLSQQQQYQQLNQAWSNNLVQLIPLQEVSEKEVEEYLDRVPDGIEPNVWEQAKQNNPDPKKFIPTPLISLQALSHSHAENKNESILKYSILILLILIPIAILLQVSALKNSTDQNIDRKGEIRINLAYIDELNQKYPGLLSSKEMRIIRTRLAVMRKEVSVLMLLGISRDSHCKLDPTFCVGQTIANATQVQFGYIDASDPDLHSDKIERELESSLDGDRYSVMIDNLEKLPGSEVMNLFRFIDRDGSLRRRGMLLFVVYTGLELSKEYSKLKEADIAERILAEKWAPFVPKDSLTSVISRMCGSIVKVY